MLRCKMPAACATASSLKTSAKRGCVKTDNSCDRLQTIAIGQPAEGALRSARFESNPFDFEVLPPVRHQWAISTVAVGSVLYSCA